MVRVLFSASLLLHTQEVTGSSPVAPNIIFNQIQERPRRRMAVCEVDCDVTPAISDQFGLASSCSELVVVPPINPPANLFTTSRLAAIRTWE